MDHDLPKTQWRKSTYSGDSGDCVEVADGFLDMVPVRDSKDTLGPSLRVATRAWSEFISGVRAGAFRTVG
ncbi:DUF397 domain-containing protein [Streptomyces olivoreticuli]|uniref:DUF397 domain-containing protein n=1 Tax=Streptomyces olivoreticuli TaxID=68246 RepID=UPI002659FEE8|nr:DUF397 domain-containing protein [Streptomyces olivoreticuli]WKK25903.1 DUF397 domain-containing protein [Streptomyces olivoreticuli]